MYPTEDEFGRISEAEEEEEEEEGSEEAMESQEKEEEEEEKGDTESLEKKPFFDDNELDRDDKKYEEEDELQKKETHDEKDEDEADVYQATEEDELDAEVVRMQSERKDRTTAAKKRMIQLLEGSSVSGLSHATGAPSWIAKVIWSVLLICGFIGLATNLTSLFSRFLKKPVLTMYIAESEKFHWPDITFCNHMNPITFWKYPGLVREWEVLIKRTKALGKFQYRGKRFPAFQHVLAMSSLDPVKFHLGESRPMFFKLSAQTKSTDISTSAGYFERFDKLRWNSSEFISRSVPTPFPTPCYTFMPAKNAFLADMERKNHSVRTIKFNLVMNFDSYEIFNSSYENRGVYMYLKERGSTVTSAEIIQLSPGSTTTVELSMSVMERLRDRQKSKCSPTAFTTTLYDADLLTTRQYNGTYDDCRYYVSQKLFLKFCGCYNPMLPIHVSNQHPPRLCFNMSIFSPPAIRANLDCLNRGMIYYSRVDFFHKELNQRCSVYKLPPCRSISYKKSQVTRSWPEDINRKRMALLHRFAIHMGEKTKNPMDGVAFVRRNFAVVQINKKYSRAKLIKEEYEYPASQLISDVGGTLGLWLGLSFVGVFELVEILLVVLNYIASECMVEKKAYNARKRIKRRKSLKI